MFMHIQLHELALSPVSGQCALHLDGYDLGSIRYAEATSHLFVELDMQLLAGVVIVIRRLYVTVLVVPT